MSQHGNGFALSMLPERFQHGPQTKTLAEYIHAKYGQYGYKRHRSIEYNQEFQPDYTRDRYRWVEHVTSFDGIRRVADAHHIIKLKHTGWYTDNYHDETIHGEVYQLPARDGECLFVPAVNDPNNDGCACLDFSSVTSDKEDAARWADSMAEHWAESEREYRAKEDAKNQIEELEQEIKDDYKDFRRIARELRASCDQIQGVKVVRELVKDKWQRVKEGIHAKRARIKRIEDYGVQY